MVLLWLCFLQRLSSILCSAISTRALHTHLHVSEPYLPHPFPVHPPPPRAPRTPRFQRGLKRKPLALVKKLRKAKMDAASGEKPDAVRTHLRNMIIVPEMIGSVVGVYNGKTFNQVCPHSGGGVPRGGGVVCGGGGGGSPVYVLVQSDHRARDDWLCCPHVQRQDLQPVGCRVVR
jgi:ribosomal protein S19